MKQEEDKDNTMTVDADTIKNDIGFWRELWQQARLVYALLRDPNVPIYLKIIPFTAVLYLLVPFDLLPDVVPALGQLDDLTAILVMSKVFIELAPQRLVAKHMAKIRAQDGRADEDPVIIDHDVAEKIKFNKNSE